MSYFQVVAIPSRNRIAPFIDRRLYTEHSQAETRIEELRPIYGCPAYELRVIVVSVN